MSLTIQILSVNAIVELASYKVTVVVSTVGMPDCYTLSLWLLTFRQCLYHIEITGSQAIGVSCH